ncbi:unnamed protein product [Periconia digitata]|uniref:Uncharacterized protein n=1 Tax=Periconia digitata TaxID=1303443 RepID=A0A9W4U5A5_9PLEO|nr:unnamed protein product [Periconia digitata]
MPGDDVLGLGEEIKVSTGFPPCKPDVNKIGLCGHRRMPLTRSLTLTAHLTY